MEAKIEMLSRNRPVNPPNLNVPNPNPNPNPNPHPNPNHNPLPALPEEELFICKAKSCSRANFAKNLITKKMMPQELSKALCSGRTVEHSGRAEVRMIPPDILRYVVSTIYQMYGV